jgi:inner membrane protein
MGGWMQTIMAKVLGIGILALLMLIPLAQVRGLVSERQQMRETSIAQIAQGWGGRQVVGGLVLAVPTQRLVVEAQGQPPQMRAGTEVVLADSVTMDVAMAVSTRRYGIYGAPVFTSTVHLSGSFLPQDLARASRASGAQWLGGQAELRLLLADLRGLQEVSALTINGRPARFQSSAAKLAGYSSVVVPIDLATLGEAPISFAMTLRVAGTGSLQVLPLARRTDVTMRAPWSDPSFVGALLPIERAVNDAGFSAHWHILDLNRSYGQYWQACGTIGDAVAASAFGVELYQPVDVYQRNERAGKYGLLFIAMTFVAFFLFEVLKRLRVHPVQYLLIGAALATFYLVLLALSEQIAFGAAYAIAAAAVVLIVGGYAMAVLRARRAGATLGAVLALVYVMLYGLVAAEQYALLVGSLVLLATVALLMYLTRRIDWYAYAPVAAADDRRQGPA